MFDGTILQKLRKKVVEKILIANGATIQDANLAAEVYSGELSAEQWAGRIDEKRATKLTPEQMELLINILKVVLTILALV